MPLCHFAFGGLHRSGDAEAQVAAFLEHILLPRELRAFECPEFLRIINSPGAKMGVPGSAVDTGCGVTFTEWVDSPPVGLLPCDVWMISFVDVSFKKLPNWAPANHYGRLGVAFTNRFKARNRIRQVQYYQLKGLERDALVKQYNRAVQERDTQARERASEVLHGYRNPAVLWPEFEELFAMLRLTAMTSGIEIEKITYSRYETGYRFHEEREARWVTDESEPVLSFDEKDVLALLAPNEQAVSQLSEALRERWEALPEIRVIESGV